MITTASPMIVAVLFSITSIGFVIKKDYAWSVVWASYAIANISLACAHPAKFKNAIFDAINQEPTVPKELKNIFAKEEKMIILENNKKLVKSEILKLI